MYELVLRSVIEVCWPATSGPNVPVFKRFQLNWQNIDKKKYETGLDDGLIRSIIGDKKNEILDFISNQLEVFDNFF